ncbi:lysophospholipase D GDPD3 isoform X2 [Dromiciops gliroides]|uniref:lysophospholipase D GDPD3 isoform X2 n=1 Tax=Dromiciops gliroides TaxID=33562 RepID=UPI001CC5EECE|nr:lysophospholipase D GDPD3 isoform X2 [Dromiciops gliroides]
MEGSLRLVGGGDMARGCPGPWMSHPGSCPAGWASCQWQAQQVLGAWWSCRGRGSLLLQRQQQREPAARKGTGEAAKLSLPELETLTPHPQTSASSMTSFLYYALPALGGYSLLSLFFLRRPWLLHVSRDPAFRCRLAAHRGGSGERLENTMEALENSMAQRSDLFELDCQLTRDGQVVISHDENLFRQSGLNKNIQDVDYEDLPLYREELEVYFSPGQFARGSDRKMIRLEDVFQRFPQTPMSLEVKVEDEKLINKIATIVKHFGRSEITIWAAEKNSVMKKCRAANPEMPTSFTVVRVIWLLLMYYVGLLPFFSIPERFLLCFLPTIINRTYFPFSCTALNRLAAALTKRLIMRKSLIRHLEERGIQVVFWCLNEESDFEVAYKLGATGVMTDYPTALRHYLDNHPQQRK